MGKAQSIVDFWLGSDIMKRARMMTTHHPSPNHMDSNRRIDMADLQYTTDIPQVVGFIYLITNKINGKQYVGQTIRTMGARWKDHISESRRCSYPIAQAIKKYGSENFEVSELARCNSIEQLNELEPLLIQQYDTLRPNGYNLASGGKNAIPHPETIQRLSESHKGKKLSPEQVEKLRQANTGRIRSEETRKKMGLASKARNTGRKQSAETIEKRAVNLRGRKFSDEHKRKISLAHTGKKLSEETKAKLSKVNMGKSLTADVIEKMRTRMIGNQYAIGNHNRRGKKASMGTRARMSIARKGIPFSEETFAKTMLDLQLRDERKTMGRRTTKGCKLSEEHKNKIRAAHLGKTVSAETRAKMSIAQKNRHKNGKEQSQRGHPGEE